MPAYTAYLKDVASGTGHLWKDASCGDILYFGTADYGYPFGHTALMLGQTSHSIVRKNGDTRRHFVVIYKAETPFARPTLRFSDYAATGNRLHDVGHHVGVTSFMMEGTAELTAEDGSTFKGRSISVISYKGPKQEEVRATSALLAYFLVYHGKLAYGGVCDLLSSFTFQKSGGKERVEEYKRFFADDGTSTSGNSGSGKRLEVVCSGFMAVVYQMAMDMHGLDVDEFMPVNARAMRPRDFFKLCSDLPHYWKSTTYKPHFSPMDVAYTEFERFAGSYPLLVHTSKFRFHESREENRIVQIQRDFPVKEVSFSSAEFCYVPLWQNSEF